MDTKAKIWRSLIKQMGHMLIRACTLNRSNAIIINMYLTRQ